MKAQLTPISSKNALTGLKQHKFIPLIPTERRPVTPEIPETQETREIKLSVLLPSPSQATLQWSMDLRTRATAMILIQMYRMRNLKRKCTNLLTVTAMPQSTKSTTRRNILTLRPVLKPCRRLTKNFWIQAKKCYVTQRAIFLLQI